MFLHAAIKAHQDYHFSCEFDAAWVVLKTYGIDPTVDQLFSIVGVDTSVEPTWAETPKGVFIYGGDITAPTPATTPPTSWRAPAARR